jgi:hypothetical protein
MSPACCHLQFLEHVPKNDNEHCCFCCFFSFFPCKKNDGELVMLLFFAILKETTSYVPHPLQVLEHAPGNDYE